MLQGLTWRDRTILIHTLLFHSSTKILIDQWRMKSHSLNCEPVYRWLHWEVIARKDGKRINPFLNPIVDNRLDKSGHDLRDEKEFRCNNFGIGPEVIHLWGPNCYIDFEYFSHNRLYREVKCLTSWTVPMDFIYLMKGFIIGFVLPIPIGPAGILCIRRTIAQCKLHGFLTGLSAAVSDMMYSIVAAFGITLVSNFIYQH